jgi:hypothetical protein
LVHRDTEKRGALRETVFSAVLVKCIVALGGYARKLQQPYAVGMPDLLIQLPGQRTLVIENKVFEMPARQTTPIKLNVTPMQFRFMRQFRAAGGSTGWMTSCEGDRRGERRVMCGTAELECLYPADFTRNAIAWSKNWVLRDYQTFFVPIFQGK